MKGFVQNIEKVAVKNNEFPRVFYTAKHCQLVVMSLKPKEEIGAEVHQLDQFFRVEEGVRDELAAHELKVGGGSEPGLA